MTDGFTDDFEPPAVCGGLAHRWIMVAARRQQCPLYEIDPNEVIAPIARHLLEQPTMPFGRLRMSNVKAKDLVLECPESVPIQILRVDIPPKYLRLPVRLLNEPLGMFFLNFRTIADTVGCK